MLEIKERRDIFDAVIAALQRDDSKTALEMLTKQFFILVGAVAVDVAPCPYCDGTEDVHRADGEWLGSCDCAAHPAAPQGEGLDHATAQFPSGTMYRSGHDGTGPDPSLFFCEAVSDAPESRRVRVVAETEAEARLQAAAALAPAAIASGREGAE